MRGNEDKYIMEVHGCCWGVMWSNAITQTSKQYRQTQML